MSYKKPQIVAKSAAKMSYAAGCPLNKKSGTKIRGVDRGCAQCERSGN